MQEYNYLAHHGIKGQRWGVRRFQDAGRTAIKFVKAHPQESLAAAGVGVAVGRKAIRFAKKKAYQHKMDTTFYDHGSQQRLKLKKKLTDKQKSEINKRRIETGKNYVEIYREMDLLKE